jgi:[acyl-carrier-protein] S-malonyltransferase
MLRLTYNSQPAIFVVSIAAHAAFKSTLNSQLPTPNYIAGLSLGEYAALVAAGSLTFGDGLRLVRKRAQIMDNAARSHPGKMAAVLDLSLDKLKEICLKSRAEIANINCPGQAVISGRAEAVDKAKNLCLAAGAKRVIDLEVSGGFHSSLMRAASEELRKVLENMPLSPPSVSVISNYTAQPQSDVARIKENLVCQMYSPVKWEDSMRLMLVEGSNKFFEFGPGKILKGLMRRIDAHARVVSIEKKEDVLSLLKEG